ncbi:hypothetical protein BgiBS90_002973, partial [Biomphalaria glabrata]|uniref:EF-hand domain-containing protein n=1 Tax=Biomphalaria glabrata TaxID=6526 RepID=A0A2C9KIL2_BIOGL
MRKNQALKRYNLTDKEFITKDELTNALQDKQLFPDEYSNLLFGPNITLDKVFRILDEDGSGKIAFRELIQFIEAHGIRMQERFQGYSRADVEHLGQFFLTLGNTVLTNMTSVHLK